MHELNPLIHLNPALNGKLAKPLDCFGGIPDENHCFSILSAAHTGLQVRFVAEAVRIL